MFIGCKFNFILSQSKLHRRSRSVSFSVPDDAGRTKSGNGGTSLDSIRANSRGLKSLDKLILNGTSPPVRTVASLRPTIVFERQQKLEIPKPRQRRQNLEISIPRVDENVTREVSKKEQNCHTDINGWEVPPLDLDFLSDDDTLRSGKAGVITGKECENMDSCGNNMTKKPPTAPKSKKAKRHSRNKVKTSNRSDQDFCK